MNQRRFLEILLVLTSISCFTLTTWFTVPEARRIEPALTGVLSLLFALLAIRIFPCLNFSGRGHYLAVLILILLAFYKHRFFFCPAHIYTLINFSLLFSLGEAFCVLAVLELYQLRIRRNHTYLVLYTFFVMIAASYTAVTDVFLPLIAVYSLVLIWLSRLKPGKSQTLSGQIHRTVAVFILVAFSYLAGMLLAHYREPLNNWTPATTFSSRQEAGFSPISRLGSKDIEISREPVLRYFALRGEYYLRGKAFAHYAKREWRQAGDFTTFPMPNELKASALYHSLVFLRGDSVIFAPLHCCGVYGQHGPARVGPAGVIRAYEQPPGTCVELYIDRNPRIPTLSLEEKACYTQLPQQNANYFRELSASIAGGESSPKKKADAIQDYLRATYPYRRKSEVTPGKEPIEDFLRQKHGAHCEMFASSMVMLARAQKIPARYVAGYYAHEFNAFGGFITIRACDAHAWAELYLPGRGWIVVDPTPPESLKNVLRSYRGFAEIFREYLSEWLRKQGKTVLWVIGFITLVLFSFAILLRGKHRRLETEKKRFAIPEPVFSTRLRTLVREFGDSTEKSFRRRYPHETFRHYCRLAKKRVPPKLNEFGRNLLTVIEDVFYGDKELHVKELETLEKSWREIAGEFQVKDER